MEWEELKPCPFCGGDPMVLPRTCDKHTPYNAADRAFPIVRCMKCWSEACGTDWSGPETAVGAWNRRAALSSQCAAPDALADMEARKDAAYEERNKVVAALAKMFPSGIARTAIEGWSEDWHGCVYIDLPTGQVSWHFHNSQAYLFDGLPPYTKGWDGHDTPEKYRRLAALRGQCAAGEAEYEGRAFVDGSWLPWHRISNEVYENRQKWPRDGYEVRTSPLPVHQQKDAAGVRAVDLPEPDCWAILTPNGSKLVPPGEAKGRKDAYRLFSEDQVRELLRASGVKEDGDAAR